MRLSAPTNRTFLIGGGALVVGVALRMGWVGLVASNDATYWLTAGGGLLLALGSMFRKL